MAGLRVLVVDDEPALVRAVARELRQDALVVGVGSLAEALAVLDEEGADPFDVVLADLELGDGRGTAVLARARERHPAALRVLMTGHGAAAADADPHALVQALLPKPWPLHGVRALVQQRAAHLPDAAPPGP